MFTNAFSTNTSKTKMLYSYILHMVFANKIMALLQISFVMWLIVISENRFYNIHLLISYSVSIIFTVFSITNKIRFKRFSFVLRISYKGVVSFSS